MKTIICLILLTVLSYGCASVKYTNEVGEEFKYTRFGSLKLNGFEAKIEGENKHIKLNSSQGNAGDLAAILKNMSEVAARMIP